MCVLSVAASLRTYLGLGARVSQSLFSCDRGPSRLAHSARESINIVTSCLSSLLLSSYPQQRILSRILVFQQSYTQYLSTSSSIRDLGSASIPSLFINFHIAIISCTNLQLIAPDNVLLLLPLEILSFPISACK